MPLHRIIRHMNTHPMCTIHNSPMGDKVHILTDKTSADRTLVIVTSIHPIRSIHKKCLLPTNSNLIQISNPITRNKIIINNSNDSRLCIRCLRCNSRNNNPTKCTTRLPDTRQTSPMTPTYTRVYFIENKYLTMNIGIYFQFFRQIANNV